MITRSKSKLVFSNPGCLLVSKQQFYDGGDSVCRNLALQKMFMMFGKAEKAGSGADKIISGWREANWIAPMLEERNRPDKVVLTLPLVSILDDKIKEELVSLFGENVIHMEHNKLLTLAFALTEDVVSDERLRFSLNMHKYDISKMLKDLCAEGFLVSDGIGRGTTYQLNKGEILTNNSANVVSSSSNVESSDCKKRLKKRCSRNELFNMIVECASEWISLEEIAREVQRSAKYLNNNIINKMVDNGLLKRLFPISNHPAQKYKGADKQQGEQQEADNTDGVESVHVEKSPIP